LRRPADYATHTIDRAGYGEIAIFATINICRDFGLTGIFTTFFVAKSKAFKALLRYGY